MICISQAPRLNTIMFCVQAYVDAVLDLASHFITRLRRYASFCRTLASAVGSSTSVGNPRNAVASPTPSSASPATSQGSCKMSTSVCLSNLV